MSYETKMQATKRAMSVAIMGGCLLLILSCQPILLSPQVLDGSGVQFATFTPSAKITSMLTATATLATSPTPIQTVISNTIITPSATLTTATSVYIIAAGDTLLDLAFRYDLSLAAIEAANPGVEPTNLQIGQAIHLPLDEEQFLAVATPTLRPTSIPQAENVTVPDYAVMENNMRQLVNRQRESRDIAPLAFDAELKAVAKGHAFDMAERNYFDHITPEGITLRDRLQQAGIAKNWVGENIQVNTLPPGQAAAEAMRWFLNSQPHLDNILAEPFTRLGVGVAEGPPGWYVFVLVFAGET